MYFRTRVQIPAPPIPTSLGGAPLTFPTSLRARGRRCAATTLRPSLAAAGAADSILSSFSPSFQHDRLHSHRSASPRSAAQRNRQIKVHQWVSHLSAPSAPFSTPQHPSAPLSTPQHPSAPFSTLQHPSAPFSATHHRRLYRKLTVVSSSSTSGRTKRNAVPLRGTSMRTGSTPATRRCRLSTFCEGAFCSSVTFA